MEIINKYFPHFSEQQYQQFSKLFLLYKEWNNKINVISRKDIDFLYERHVLHSLAISCVLSFEDGSVVLDVGTGGGFPGIPLAIAFPNVQFTLIDSIGKKIFVVQQIINSLGLNNVVAQRINAKELKGKYQYIVSRAVCKLEELVSMTKKNWTSEGKLIVFKGGEVTEELNRFKNYANVVPIANYFKEPFFETKKIILLSYF